MLSLHWFFGVYARVQRNTFWLPLWHLLFITVKNNLISQHYWMRILKLKSVKSELQIILNTLWYQLLFIALFFLPSWKLIISEYKSDIIKEMWVCHSRRKYKIWFRKESMGNILNIIKMTALFNSQQESYFYFPERWMGCCPGAGSTKDIRGVGCPQHLGQKLGCVTVA